MSAAVNPSVEKKSSNRNGPQADPDRPTSILVVDDEPGIRAFLQRALSKRYGLVEVAEDAETAQELCKRCHFDLLIVDIRLPGRSGLECIQELRASGAVMDVIFITAYAEVEATIGDRELPVNVRILTATNRNLGEEVKAGRFREDLYYRLNVVTIRMPSLRECVEDIPELLDFLSKNLAQELGMSPVSFTQEEISRLQQYAWPGNVRELRNLVERALLLGRLPWDALGGTSASPDSTAASNAKTTGFPTDWTLEQVEMKHMLRVLDTTEGNKSEAARRLGVSRKTLERKLRSRATAAQDS